jgi:hypothetical protein
MPTRGRKQVTTMATNFGNVAGHATTHGTTSQTSHETLLGKLMHELDSHMLPRNDNTAKIVVALLDPDSDTKPDDVFAMLCQVLGLPVDKVIDAILSHYGTDAFVTAIQARVGNMMSAPSGRSTLRQPPTASVATVFAVQGLPGVTSVEEGSNEEALLRSMRFRKVRDSSTGAYHYEPPITSASPPISSARTGTAALPAASPQASRGRRQR